jgi:hypothetical protein
MNPLRLSAGALVVIWSAFAGGAPRAAAQFPFRVMAPTIPTAAHPYAAFDADGDGDRDLYTILGMLLNDGTGRFVGAAGAPVFTFGNPRLATAADLDGDGDLDLALAVPNTGVSTLFISYNDGGGVFGPPIALSPSGAFGLPPTPTQDAIVVVGDVDGDGRPDVAGPGGGFQLDFQLAPGVFTDVTAAAIAALPAGSPITLLTGGDLDGDGRTELLLDVGQNSVLLRHQGGAFSASVVPGSAAGSPVSAASGDFDGDGRVDFAVSRTSAGLGAHDEFVFQPGAAAFGVVHARPSVARLGAIDVGADGRDDLLRTDPNGAVVLDVLTGAPLPAPPLFDAPPGVAPYGGSAALDRRFVVFDANGDGVDDLAGFIDVSAYGLMFGTSSGGFVGGASGAPRSTGTAQSVFADFDLDGDLDFAYAALSGGASSLGFRASDGKGRYSAPIVPGLVPDALRSRFVTADFDADGLVDAMQFPQNQAPRFHRQTASGTFAATTHGPATVFDVFALAATDYDFDGDFDVTFAGRALFGFSGFVSGVFVVINLGGGAFSGVTALAVTPQNLAASLLQADGDGVPDYVLTHAVGPPASYQYSIYSGATGAALTVLGTGPSGGSAAPGVAVADLNGDGADDVAADAAAWLGGAAGFAPIASPLPALFGSTSRVRFLRDFDADGVLDFLSADLGFSQFAPGVATGGLGPAVNSPGVFILSASLNAAPVVADFDRDGDLDFLDPRGVSWTNVSAGLSSGTPAVLGLTASFDVDGPPGAPFELFVATSAFAQNPVAIPNFGNLWLDPSTAIYVGPGVCGASGTTTISLAVPNISALAGLSLWWQSVLPQATRFSNALETPIYAP